MKITVLTENISENPELTAEHGLSLYIETKHHKILFDMGQTDAFYKNAELLDIDLSKVNIAILSHGHYDHGGGIKKFLSVNKTADLYLSRNALGDYFNKDEKYIGLDKTLSANPRLVFVGDKFFVDDELSIHSCNNEQLLYPINPFGLNVNIDGEIKPDTFLHEQYLLISENGRRILISGCSHKGILNIVEWLRADYFIGGFHFSKLNTYGQDANVLKHYAEVLKKSTVQKYYTCHCTGYEQYGYLKEIMGEKLEYISVGCKIEI